LAINVEGIVTWSADRRLTIKKEYQGKRRERVYTSISEGRKKQEIGKSGGASRGGEVEVKAEGLRWGPRAA